MSKHSFIQPLKRYFGFITACLLLIISLLSFNLQASVYALADNPQIGVAKTATNIGRLITFNFYLENLGDENLTKISLFDDLDAVFGAGNYTITSLPIFVDNPGTITLNSGFDGSADTDVFIPGSSSLAIGDTAQIQMDVEITTVTDQGSGLGFYSNQATIQGTTFDETITTDTSDNGIDPDPNSNGNADEAGENDPTPIDLLKNPIIGIAKNATLDGTQVTLDFYLKNYGNRDLSNLSLIDDLDAVFGAGNYNVGSAPIFIDNPGTVILNGGFDGSGDQALITSGSLEEGDTAQIQVVVNITNVTDQGLGLGVYSNQVTVMGDPPIGSTVTDVSHRGSNPDVNNDGLPTEDDPTIFVIGEDPVIGIAKDATVNGDDVTIDIYLENLGNVPLQKLTLTDELDSVFGAGNYVVSVAPMLIDDPGTIELNSNFDGSNDPLLITPIVNDERGDPIEVSNSTLALGDTAQIQMVVTVTNLDDIGLGTGVYENQAAITAESQTGALTADLSDNGTDPDPNGNGNPTDPGEDDVTPISVVERAVIGVSKEIIVDSVGAFAEVTTIWRIENLGNVTLSNISMTDDLNAVFGAGNFIHVTDPTADMNTVNTNSAFNGSTNTAIFNGGSTLEPGFTVEVFIVTLVTNIVDQGFGLGTYQNQVTVLATDPSANPVSDVSDSGSDPDPNGNGDPTEAGENDPTEFTVNSFIGVAKDVSVNGAEVTLDFYLENFGLLQLTDITLNEDLDTIFGEENYLIASGPTLIDDPGTLILNPSFDGSSDSGLFDSSSSTLVAGDTAQVRLVITVLALTDFGSGFGVYSSQVEAEAKQSNGTLLADLSVDGTDPDLNNNDTPTDDTNPTAIDLFIAGVGAAKNATVIESSSIITFDIYLESFGTQTSTNVSVIDNLDTVFGTTGYTITSPPVFIDDPGTLTLNGAFDGSNDTEILAPGSSSLNAGDTAQIQFAVEVGATGVYSNQVTVTSSDPNGFSIVDLSTSGTTPTQPDLNESLTRFDVGKGTLGMALHAYAIGNLVTFEYYLENLGTVPIDLSAIEHPLNPVFGSGNYSVVQQPTLISGPDTLVLSTNYFGFSVFDIVVAGGTLAAGETAHARFVVNVTNVTDVGSGLGVYDAQVTGSATSYHGAIPSDTSDYGIDPDPNGNGDPTDANEGDVTPIIIGDEALLGVAKNVTAVGNQASFDFYLENFGASTLNNLSLIEDLDAVFGLGNYTVGAPTLIDDPGTITLSPGYDGSSSTELIDAGSTLPGLDTAQIRVVVTATTIVDQGLGAGVYQNQVDVTASAPLGSMTFDTSDFGTNPDPTGDNNPIGDGEDDPTQFTFPLTVSAVGIAKQATVSDTLVIFDYYVGNIGNDVLTNVTLLDDLDAVFGMGNYELVSGPEYVTDIRNLVLNTGFDGSVDTVIISSGAINDPATEQVQLAVQVNQLIDQGAGLGVYTNQVTINANGSIGVISDLSDDGTIPDPNGNTNPSDPGEDDPTVFTVAEMPVIGVAKSVTVTGRTVTMDFYLENLGNVDLNNLSLTDTLDSTFGAGNYQVVSAPALIDDPGSIVINSGFDGSSDPALITSGSLVYSDTAQIRLVVDVTRLTDQGGGLGIYSNQATASATGPSGGSTTDLSDDGTISDPNGNGDPTEIGEDDASSITVHIPVLSIQKVVTPVKAVHTDLITYTFTFTNVGNDIATNVVITDILPISLTNVVSSSSGVSITPTVNVDFAWTVQDLGAGQQGRITLSGVLNTNVVTITQVTNTVSIAGQDIDSQVTSSDDASATLEIIFVPTFSKTFNPSPIIVSGVSSLTFTIDNTGGTINVTGLDFVDNLPTGLVVATPSNKTKTCPGGMVDAGDGASFIGYSGGSVLSGTTCTISVNVTANGAATGVLTNMTGDLTSSLGNSGAATAMITVNPQPTFSKGFVPDSIGLGLTSTLVFTIDNSLSTVDATGLTFTDTMPSAITIATPVNSTTTCSGLSLNVLAGTNVITVSNGTVSAGTSCTISVDVVGMMIGAYTNTTGYLTSSLGTSSVASDILTINPQPIFSKSFSPDGIGTDLTSTLVFTIDNTASTFATSGLTFIDNLPSGMVVATPANEATGCGGSVTAVSGSSIISYSGGMVGSGTSCTVSVDVTSSIAGTYINTTEPLNSSLGSSDVANATLVVNEQPMFSKTFVPDVIMVGESSTLSFTIRNVSNTIAVTSLEFIDNLPANVVVATPANATTTCSGVVSATSNSSVISLSNSTVAIGESCTVSVDVTSTVAGIYTNTTGSLNSSLGIGNVAIDILTVNAQPEFNKMFIPDVIVVDETSILSFTISNLNSTVAASDLTFTDNLPSNLVVASPANNITTCGGTITATASSGVISYGGGSVNAGASCTISVAVTSSVAGTYTNTTEPLSSSLGLSNVATASLTIEAEPVSQIFHLPLVIKEIQLDPDLRIRSVTPTNNGNDVELIIENVGLDTTTAGFWVDLYINPVSPPSINDVWQNISSNGAAWGVTTNIAPSEVITLTLTSPAYLAGFSNFTTLTPGTTIWVQVDSLNSATMHGNILERDETNNIFGPTLLTSQQIQQRASEAEPISESANNPAQLPQRK
ncbi:MAG: hypothetical protein AAF629_05230 [Chloroflexota bacterium]